MEESHDKHDKGRVWWDQEERVCVLVCWMAKRWGAGGVFLATQSTLKLWLGQWAVLCE